MSAIIVLRLRVLAAGALLAVAAFACASPAPTPTPAVRFLPPTYCRSLACRRIVVRSRVLRTGAEQQRRRPLTVIPA